MKKIFSKSMFKFLFAVGVFLVSANLCNAVATITVTPTASTSVIHKGGSATIYYTVTGSITGCYVDAHDGNGLLPIPAKSSGSFSVSPTVTTTYTVTCEYVVAAPSCDSYEVALNTCFTADTKVILSDGSSKNIQDIKIGDVLKGETSNNTVLGFHDPKLEDGKLYSFNGGRYFVTAEHPFKTTDGWKSINPEKTLKENIGITVTALHVGDTLITENGKVLLKTIDSKNDKVDTQLYNFKLDGDHTYYADGYLVHNKQACGGGYSCGAGSICIDANGYPADPNGSGGTCKACPGTITCNSGYAASCSGGYVVCIQTSCTGSYSCTGTVTGSSPTTYEGQSCTQFTSSTTCLQGWLTNGCSWGSTQSPTGTCNSILNSGPGLIQCPKLHTASNCSANVNCQWVDTQAL